MAIKVFLVDDHMVLREGLKALIAAQPDMQVVGEASDGVVVGRYARRPAATTDLLGADLSEREREVVQRVAQGYSNKEIGTQLSLSVKTVETYRARAMEKLGLSSRSALVRYALERGWLRKE